MMTTKSNGSPDLALLAESRHHNPHHFLGLHDTPDGQVIRLWRPGAEKIYLEVLGQVVEAQKASEQGLFEYVPGSKISAADYRIYHQSGLLAPDPYAVWPTIGEIDAFLFNKGCHYDLYSALGANVRAAGTQFAVWAPNARGVYLVGDFNHWDGRMCPMRSMGASGIWELFVPGIGQGQKYKFEIHTREGLLRVKSDPFAFFSELRPLTASVVFDVNAYQWQDAHWRKRPLNGPMNIYEVHLGSWRNTESDSRIGRWQGGALNLGQAAPGSPKTPRLWGGDGGAEAAQPEGLGDAGGTKLSGCPTPPEPILESRAVCFGSEFPNYRAIAGDLAKYCKEMGFTHVELMPVMEHPLDESWGYQVTGFFSVTSRYGTPADFQFFVDHLHQEGIGVILDWVPAHFPTDDYSLNRFDGTALYEHEDPRKGIHPHWQTAIFNYGRKEVTNFLIASALFWFDKMHIDGLRVDAVASMLYLDYGRKAGEWIPNPDGSNFNIDAIEFLKHLNSIVHERFPGALMIAEESSSYAGVTHKEGLGFDLKWNMGWMNDTLRYFCRDPIYRKFHQNELTFGLLYAFTEKFVLVLSHDEVVHGKGSLINKMPGTEWQKFANLRLIYSYMLCQPGKKLLFMGGEIAQGNEWDCKSNVDWHLLQYPLHQGVFNLVRDLNRFYLAEAPLWEADFDWKGFEWIDFSDEQKSIISYLRKGGGKSLVCIHNFTPEYHADYWIKLRAKRVVEVFNTDAPQYGGSSKLNESVSVQEEGFLIQLAPLATMIFEVEF